MGIMNELERAVRDEEEVSAEKIVSKIDDKESEGAGVDDIIKHIENVEAAVNYIDKLTPGENGEVAFDAEIALRKAISKMKELQDTVYKEVDKEDKEELETEV